MKIPIFLSFSVPSLSKARRQPTSYHVATAQEVQKPHNSRLQELGCGHYQYVTSKHTGILHKCDATEESSWNCCCLHLVSKGFSWIYDLPKCANTSFLQRSISQLFMYRQYASKNDAYKNTTTAPFTCKGLNWNLKVLWLKTFSTRPTRKVFAVLKEVGTQICKMVDVTLAL